MSLKRWMEDSLPDTTFQVIDTNLLGPEDEYFTEKLELASAYDVFFNLKVSSYSIKEVQIFFPSFQVDVSKKEQSNTSYGGNVFTMERPNVDWWIIGIYASTDDQIRRNQWEVVERRKELWGPGWMITGDFNDIISNQEKLGGGGGRKREGTFKDFRNFIEQNGLIDLGFEGNPWTWSNHWAQEGEIKQRLDRALGSCAWSQIFYRTIVKHIENFSSDHSMILLDSNPLKEKRKKRFLFDRRWMKKDGREQVVKQAWEEEQIGSNMY
ncbi:uncharacterized protein [Coffea arabica]|uniref:Endonuclease/exonuclease/phosphatase domain-containing protein n=1 Tax=Coffea arabica TaxID=13443 RepID=A0ABM4WML8_COFAR